MIYKSRFKETIEQINTPEFKKWFGNSKVVKGGKPLVVYHGSNRKFDTFSYKYMGDTDDLFLGAGFYFSSSKKIAKGYGSKIIECYLSIQNPLIIEDSYSFGGVHPDKIKEILNIPLKSTPKNIWDELQKQGYDGVVVNSPSNKMIEIVALKLNQIKSAIGNNGEFSLQSNNIYESRFKEKLYHPDAIAIDKKPYDIYVNPSVSELSKIDTIRSDKACRGMIDMRKPKLVLMSSYRLLHSDAIYALENIPVGDVSYGTLRNHYIRLIFDFNNKIVSVDYIPKGKEKLVLENSYLKNQFSGWRVEQMYEIIGEL